MSGASGKHILLRGAAWTVAMRWGVKMLGLINTLVMARILMPSEYGVVAMASIVAGIIESLLDFGAGTALLRKSKLNAGDIDSAWTLRVLQGIAVGLLLILLSPAASLYFSEPRVAPVLWTLGACVMVNGTTNIGLILAQKNFDFSIDFKVSITAAVVRVLVTIAAGLALGDYRALVIGIAVGLLTSTVLSYVMHPYRPRWNTKNIAEIWAVTKWLMLSNTGRYLMRRGDELIAGRLVNSAGEFGVYSVGADLGQLPTSEVGPAMQRAVLPLLSSMSGSAKEVNSVVVKVVNAVNTVTLPLGLGLAALSVPFTALVLGPNWAEAQFYIAGFAAVGVQQTMPGPINTLLVLRDCTKQHSMTVWFEFGALVLTALALVPIFSLAGLVWARAIGAAVGFLRVAVFARGLCELSLRTLWGGLWRPVLGSLQMYILVRWASTFAQSAIAQLAIGVTVGVVFYVGWCLLAWRLVGRPDGLESMALTWLAQKVGRRRSG